MIAEELPAISMQDQSHNSVLDPFPGLRYPETDLQRHVYTRSFHASNHY